MTNYRKAGTNNLVIGVALILLGVGAIVGLTSNNLVDVNLFWAMCFILVVVLMGGYETGKYSEMRHEQRKSESNLT
jgi:hypothetical protein